MRKKSGICFEGKPASFPSSSPFARPHPMALPTKFDAALGVRVLAWRVARGRVTMEKNLPMNGGDTMGRMVRELRRWE